MTSNLPDLTGAMITISQVEVDKDNLNIYWGTALCPRHQGIARFKQVRYPMNYWKMANATWECQTCEWDFAGRIEGPVEGEESEPEVELYSDPDD